MLRGNGPPLAGVKILDLSRILPGPYATMILAQLGAEVTSVAMPKMLDPLLAWFNEGAAREIVMNTIYAGKKSILLNFKKEEGRNLVLKMAARSDVFVEGFRVGALEKIGLGYRDVAKINPRIIYCSISGYGQTGPYRRRGSHDINYMALSGFLSMMARVGAEPVLTPAPMGDLAGGSLPAVIAILAALWERTKSGKGQWIDTSILDGLFSMMFLPYAAVLKDHGSYAGCLQTTGRDPFYSIYPTGDDRFLAVGAVESLSRDLLLNLINRQDLAALAQDKSRWEELRQELRKIFQQKTMQEWMVIFDDQEVCVSPVLTIEEALKNPQLSARRRIRHSASGAPGAALSERGRHSASMAFPSHPFSFSRSRLTTGRRTMRIGQHTRSTLRSLGLPKAAIGRLQRNRVI